QGHFGSQSGILVIGSPVGYDREDGEDRSNESQQDLAGENDAHSATKGGQRKGANSRWRPTGTLALAPLALCTDQEANGHGARQTKDRLADEQHSRRW